MRSNLGGFASIIGVALCLSACGPSTPLSQALIALRDGDRDAFLHAKEEALAVEKTATKVSGNHCTLLSSDYFVKHGEAETIRKLDKARVFTMTPDERLVFAVNVAGVGAFVDVNDPGAQAVLEYTGNTCPPMSAEQEAKADANTEMARSSDIARRRVLQNWLTAVVSKYGDQQFQSQMRKAASHLTSTGLSSRWPVIGTNIGNQAPQSNFKAAAQAMEDERALEEARRR